jgi:hypothetical protein
MRNESSSPPRVRVGNVRREQMSSASPVGADVAADTRRGRSRASSGKIRARSIEECRAEAVESGGSVRSHLGCPASCPLKSTAPGLFHRRPYRRPGAMLSCIQSSANCSAPSALPARDFVCRLPESGYAAHGAFYPPEGLKAFCPTLYARRQRCDVTSVPANSE